MSKTYTDEILVKKEKEKTAESTDRQSVRLLKSVFELFVVVVATFQSDTSEQHLKFKCCKHIIR